MASSFDVLGLSEFVLRGAAAAGFEKPSAIQAAAIPAILSGQDIIGQAHTGSGKTAAFILPALDLLKFNQSVEILVLVPTRELARQVVLEFERLGAFLKIRVANIVGGQSAERQISDVNHGAQVAVATPGRLLDHLRSNTLKRFQPGFVVLDEADEMLDMGFIDDIRQILARLPKERQTLLFSATMPDPIARLARQELSDPYHIKMNTVGKSHDDIEQFLYVVKEEEKEIGLVRLLDSEQPTKSIVFCRTRRDTDALCRNLVKRGIRARALHGELAQSERNRAIFEIKSGNVDVLVATDVASRGLDIPDLSHVFNYHAPETRDRYIHRIGRTGRAGRKGKAVTLASPGEMRGNSVYARRPKLNFQLAALPSRHQVEKQLDRELISTVKSTPITDNARAFCETLVGKDGDAFELLCRLYSHAQGPQKVQGPDSIGFSTEEIARICKPEPRIEKARRGGRPGDRRGPAKGFRSGGNRRPGRAPKRGRR